jgi:protocatechuate 3,4-dioxygenase beta subunit
VSAHRSIGASVLGAAILAAAWLFAVPVVADDQGAQRRDFELRVVGPDGKAVAEAAVQIRMSPAMTAEQVERGKLVKKQPGECAADADGVLAVKLPDKLTLLQVFITTPGYGPYCARWQGDQLESLPAKLTAELDAGWSVGGIVVDSDGNPAKGAKVHPSIEFKKPPSDQTQLAIGTALTTDAAGKWHFDSVPLSMGDLSVEITHTSFRPSAVRLARGEFGIERSGEPTGKILMDRGLMITGRVTDETGNPVAGAVILSRFINDKRETKTGEDGLYHLSGCVSGAARIVVWAKGKATDMKDVTAAADMQPVDFQMQPGGNVRIRVLDEQGKPVPKARVFFQRWHGDTIRYFEFDKVNQYADQNGVWEWQEAPLDEFQADICPPGGMQLTDQPIVARAEEYIFHTSPALVISGNAIDAETHEPIKNFRAIQGALISGIPRVQWFRERIDGIDGHYQVHQDRGYPAHLVKIEAEGYLPAISRNIKSDEGNVTINFELKKGSDLAATLLAPDGKPAPGAKIVLGRAGSQIEVENGDIQPHAVYSASQTTSDADGRFHFSPQSEPFQIVITHQSGFVRVASSNGAIPDTLTLTPWAKVEGTFRVGQNAMPSIPLELHLQGFEASGQGEPRIYSRFRTMTDKDGHFAFERAVPGSGRIGREITFINEGATEVTSSCRTPIELEPGKTTHFDLGGSGSAVVGKLEPLKGFAGKVNWRMAEIWVEVFVPPLKSPDPPPIPADVAAEPLKKAVWMNGWLQTDAGRTWTVAQGAIEAGWRRRENGPYIFATLDKDGRFRIDDVPQGDYSLSVRFNLPNGAAAPGQISNYQFQVPASDAGKPGQEVDLGVLRLGN